MSANGVQHLLGVPGNGLGLPAAAAAAQGARGEEEVHTHVSCMECGVRTSVEDEIGAILPAHPRRQPSAGAGNSLNSLRVHTGRFAWSVRPRVEG